MKANHINEAHLARAGGKKALGNFKAFALGLAGASLFAVASYALASEASAEGLEGSWRGGGSVVFSGGTKERARCRANYSRASKTSYTVNATCATSSATVSQSATVRGSGSSFQGKFYNAEYDASGTIYVVVHGSSQTVRLNSTKGSALLRLSR